MIKILGKISKKEKRGRRNQRLRKILQPKNALMVLNEIVGGQKYNVTESPVTGNDNESFLATVTVEGHEYIGNGMYALFIFLNTCEYYCIFNNYRLQANF